MKTKLFLISSGLAVLAASALAQNIKFQEDVRGSGEIDRRTNQRIDRVQVKLLDDRIRTAEITFSGSRTERVIGRWNDGRRDRFEIDLREAFGDRDATGSIILELKNGRLERLTINGDTRNERFSGSFTRGSAGGTLDWRSDFRGEGNFSIGRDRQSLREAGLRLNKDGRFTLTIPGRSGEISGNYTENRDGRLSLDVNRAFDLRSVSGSGTMTLSRDRRGLDRVDLNVRSSRDSLSLNFRATPSGSGGGGGNLPGGIRELARKSDDGQGILDYRREKKAFEDFEFKLDRDGRFWARFDNNRRDEIRGTWSVRQQFGKPDQILLSIERAFGDDQARGTGDVKLDGRSNSYTVYFNGEANRSNFTVSYKSDGDRNGGIGSSIIDRTVLCKGDGTQYVRNTKVSWKECRIRLNRNGEMEFSLDGSSRNMLEGTYLRVRDGEYSFSVSNGRGLRLRGSVFTDRDNRSVRRVTFEGSDRETDFRGDLTVRSTEESRR